jgi:hypothetical protein
MKEWCKKNGGILTFQERLRMQPGRDALNVLDQTTMIMDRDRDAKRTNIQNQCSFGSARIGK